MTGRKRERLESNTYFSLKKILEIIKYELNTSFTEIINLSIEYYVEHLLETTDISEESRASIRKRLLDLANEKRDRNT